MWLVSGQPLTTSPLRRLPITAKSTKLARLDLHMRGLGQNTPVKEMKGYRAKGLSVDWLHQMTARDGNIEADSSTRLEKLCFLVEGSPTLRYNHPRQHQSSTASSLSGSAQRSHFISLGLENFRCQRYRLVRGEPESGSLPKRESPSANLGLSTISDIWKQQNVDPFVSLPTTQTQ